MLGRIMAPIYIYFLIFGTYKYITLNGKKKEKKSDFEDVIKLRILK